MDRRQSPRQTLAAHERASVALKLLSLDGESDVTLAATLVETSDRGLRLITAQRITPGTPLRLELPDRWVLGDVCFCQPQASGHFLVGIRISQILDGLASLRRLAERLMGELRADRSPSTHSL